MEEAPDKNKVDTDDDVKIKNDGDSFFRDLLKFSLISIAIVLPFRLLVASPFVVNGSSMDPTFHSGEYLIVDQLSYRFAEPERGEVVIFHYPEDPSKFFIKRIIGLPGETVVLEGETIRIINQENPDGFVLDQSFLTHTSSRSRNDYNIFTLKDEEYVVLGDNRTASSDSRIWGPVEERLIVGRAFLRLFPLSNVGYLPGDINTNEL